MKQVIYVDNIFNGPNWKVVVDVNHWYIWNILENVFQVLAYDIYIYIFHENNSTNLTLFVDFTNFELHETQVINVKSITAEVNVQGDDYWMKNGFTAEYLVQIYNKNCINRYVVLFLIFNNKKYIGFRL